MISKTFKQRLEEHGSVFGIFSKTNDPFFVDAAGLAGFDFIILDTEHGPNSPRDVFPLIKVAENTNMFPIVRVGKLDALDIQRVLDLGPAGVQIPQVNTLADAKNAVAYSKFYSKYYNGERGVCRFVPAANHSLMPKSEYFEKANQGLVITHIEGLEGVKNLDEILTVPGIDVIFIGPYDLSQSMGIPGQVADPRVQKKIQEIVGKCKEKGKHVGTFADTPEAAERYVNLGVKYISYSVDTGIYAQACKDLTDKLNSFKKR